MAVTLVFTIAAYRKVCAVRKSSQKVDRVPGLGRRHFHLVFPCEGGPLGGRRGLLAKLHGQGAGREVGEPDVVPVLGRKLQLGDSSRRTAHRPNPRSFARDAGASKADDAQTHFCTKFMNRPPYLAAHTQLANCKAPLEHRVMPHGQVEPPNQETRVRQDGTGGHEEKPLLASS